MDCADENRDPSFLTAGEPDPESWKKPIKVVPKNLCSSEWSLLNNEQYKVFLRMKPGASRNMTQTVLDRNTLLTTVPKESVTYKALSITRAILKLNNSLNLQRKFGFTSILNETATQHDVFKEIVLQPLKAFLQGEDCLVMAYGTTSAGKTFTMQGTPEEPGIIPRALTYIFQNLEQNLEDSAPLQPYRGTQLFRLNEKDIAAAKKFKNELLYCDLSKFQRCNDSSYISYKSFSRDEATFKSVDFGEIETKINVSLDGSLLGKTSDQLSVWMSMVEMYNDNILDLLQFPTESEGRPSLSLGADGRGGFYVKNAQHIQVRSGHEAYQVSQFGRLNLHRASTALNDKSSRSHCILTLSLVRRHEDFGSCNRICFVDLAGSERVKKTRNAGQRLIESHCINKSLSVLGRCLQVLKSNQIEKSSTIVPVRDSKLTKLFKNAMLGLEKLTFIINISTDPLIFDETLHVLKFAALAQEIVTAQPAKRPTRFSQICQGSLQPSSALSSFPSVSDLTDKSDDSNRMKEMLDEAERRVRELDSKNLAYKEEIKDLWDHYDEAEKRAQKLGALLLKDRKEHADVKGSLSQHYSEVLERRNKQHEENMDLLRKKMTRTQTDTENYYKMVMKGLEAENKKLKSDKKNYKELLREAVDDHRNVMNENTQLKEMLQSDVAIDSELYEDKIEELSATLAAVQEQLQSARNEQEQLTTDVRIKDDKIASLQQDLDKLSDVWLDAHLVHSLEGDYEKFRALETKLQDLITECDGLKKELLHEKEVKKLLDNEVKILKKSVKEMCTKEMNQLNEIAALKAAISSLEHEASSKQSFAHGKSMEEIANLRKEKSALEECCTRYRDEQAGYVNKLKTMEMNLMATQKKLEVAEYQRKVFETLKEKSDDELKVVADLKETIERLENELINKEHEFLAFESSRNLLIAQHEIEIEKYREESTRLKKEVQFNRDFMLENLKHSAKKEEMKSLQEQLTTMKFALRENYVERSPLGNRTNLLPVGNLVNVTPFVMHRESAENQPRLSRIFSSLDDLTRLNLKTPMKNSNSLPSTPVDKAKSTAKKCDDLPAPARSTRPTRSVKKKIIFRDDSAERDGEQKTPAKEGEHSNSLPDGTVPKSKNGKPRTLKKRDPSDHPALSRSTRGRRRSVSPPQPVDEKAKKKLFSSDDFVELSDQEETTPVVTSQQQKRTLRPRSRKT